MENRVKKQRIVIISLDAVGRQDMEYMLTLPNFKKIVDNGAFCDNVYSVYPSLTYPAHSSIVSGKTPDHHKVVSNTFLQPSRKTPDWLYKRKYIAGDTIVELAKRKGYKISAFLWPVMGGAKIDYNIPEVMVTRKYQNQVTACLANGTPGFLLDVNKKFGHIRRGTSQPELDNFLMATIEYNIKKADPDMMLIHFTDVDTTRHNYGVNSEEAKAALRRHDERLGLIREWLASTRSLDNTTFIVLGDHCQADTHTIVYLNKVFKDKGYFTLKNGLITDYKAIVKSCDGSAYVYLNDEYAEDEAFLDDLADTLNEIKKDPSLGVETIFTAREAEEMGADSECFAMIEGKTGYYFLEEYEVLTEAVADTKNHKMFGVHGYLPDREDNRTFFVCEGKGIKKGARVDSMHLYDEGPTIAALLGSELKEADGSVICEFLE